MRFFTAFSIYLFFNFSMAFAYLNPNAGEVVKVRGNVTQLRPGAWTANKVRVGDRLKEDTSVLTGKKSFVSIRLADDSRINLGPNSKFVLAKMDSKEGGIISLLKGKIRAKVKKDASRKKNKLFIQTRTAAMGVRGTDFQTIYNPDNRVTSMLTYQGKVAMVKVKEEDYTISKKTNEKLEWRSNTEQSVAEAREIPETDAERMSELLEKKETVIVESGQYSGTVEKIDRVSQPVKISPVQLGILYRNDEFAERKVSKIKSADLTNIEKNPFKIRQAEQAAPPEGFFDKKTGEYAPKAGGVLDPVTGLYLPPGRNSEFDAKNKVYVAKDLGSIDKETGQYKAPKGLVLDAKKGFLVDKKNAQDEDLLAKANSLNSNVATDLILAAPKPEGVPSIRVFTSKERFAKESLYLTIRGFDHTLASENHSSVSDRTADESGKGFHLLWNHGSGSRWQLMTGLGVDLIDFSGQFGLNQKSDKLVNVTLGLRYALGNRWNLIGLANIDQDLFIATVTTDNGNVEEITKVATTKFGAGLEGTLIRAFGGRFSFDTELTGFYNTTKSSTGFEIQSGFGFEAKIMASYWFSSNLQAKIGPRFGSYDRELQGSNNSFRSDGKEDYTGVDLVFGYLF